MARNFGFAKRNKIAATHNDDLLMPVGPVWAISLTVIAIIIAAMLLR